MKVTIDGVEYRPHHPVKTNGYIRSFAVMFSEARKHAGMTLAQVTAATGLNEPAIYRAECGSCSFKVGIKLAALYGISTDSLLLSITRDEVNHVPASPRTEDDAASH